MTGGPPVRCRYLAQPRAQGGVYIALETSARTEPLDAYQAIVRVTRLLVNLGAAARSTAF